MRNLVLLACLAVAVLSGCAAGQVDTAADSGAERILVFGASGRSGRYIIEELKAENRNFRAVTSNVARAQENLGTEYQWVEADVRDPAALAAIMAGTTHIISALGATKFTGENGPEFVDYQGVRNVVDAAKAAGVRQLVLISASGVTNPDHPLNKLGNVMTWKLKGEDYLRSSGLPYTIVRPGGLKDTPAGEGAIVFRQGDDLPYTSKMSVTSRSDLALICIRALDEPGALNRTFEVFSDVSRSFDPAWTNLYGTLVAD